MQNLNNLSSLSKAKSRCYFLGLLVIMILAGCGGSDATSNGGGAATNTAPVANAGSDQSLATGSTVSLSGAGSTDADGDALTYAWSLTSVPTGSAASLSSTSSESTDFVADLDGSYVASLTVNDGTSDSTADTVTITASTAGTGSLSLTSDALKSGLIVPTSALCDSDGEMIPLSWSNAPADTQTFVVTMLTYPNINDKGDLSRANAQIVLYDIDATETRLAAGDTSNATVGSAYNAPCSADSADHSYFVTLYATTLPAGNILIDATSTDSTLVQVTNAISANISEEVTLDLTRSRYNPNQTEHEASAALDTCAEKIPAFADYGNYVTVSCSDATNILSVTSHTGHPERSALHADKLNVGIKSWIGRVSIEGESSWEIPVAPVYITDAIEPSNISIHDYIGITVTGVTMLHYAKEGTVTIADPAADYSALDTMLLGEVDQCGGHAGNGEDYHLHGAPICMMDTHDVSLPVAYMFDGIPLYFGTGGGVLSGGAGTNYGGGRYSAANYDYRPSDVKSGSVSLDACNAYQLSGGEYIYYTSAQAPYTIGCFRGNADQAGAALRNLGPIQTNLSWSGSQVELTDYATTSYGGFTWTYIEATPDLATNMTLATVGRVLYRPLEAGENGYSATQTCYTFIYRTDASDETGASDTIDTPISCR